MCRQGLAIEGLAMEGFITSYMDYTKDDVASGIQDFLITMEMALISYAHKFVFSFRDMEKIVSKYYHQHHTTLAQALSPVGAAALMGVRPSPCVMPPWQSRRSRSRTPPARRSTTSCRGT